MKKCGFLPKLTASCALAVGRRLNISVDPGSVSYNPSTVVASMDPETFYGTPIIA